MKALIVASTDWHIKRGNTEQIKDLIRQKIDLAKSLEVYILVCLGDVFESRKSQEIDVLSCFSEILDMIYEADMELVTIAGNHDKTDYLSDYSFLEPFKFHPALVLNPKVVSLSKEVDGIFVPYFDDPLWFDKFTEAEGKSTKKKKILFSHRAVDGSVNNDGSKVGCEIKPDLFKDYEKVFLGHYHNQQKIGKNVYHLPSLQQNNFGEDANKGFTVLFEDLSHELVKSKFKEFRTVKFDLSDSTIEDVLTLANKLSKEDSNVRFILTGDEKSISSIDSSDFSKLGVKLERRTVGEPEKIDVSQLEIKKVNKTNIEEFFIEFAAIKGLDAEKGLSYIKRKLK